MHSTVDKENIERYELENKRLKRMNDLLQKEISKKSVISSRKHLNNTSVSLRRKTNWKTLGVTKSPPKLHSDLTPTAAVIPLRSYPTV